MDKSFISSLLFFVLIFSSFSLKGQEVIGVWEIEEVKVGGDIMTPVAKWTRINTDGTYETGNGWSQSARGEWYYDKNIKSLRLQETEGMQVHDQNGPFQLSFEADKMRWEREEDGANVLVIFKRADKLPMATADKLLGIWNLQEIRKNGNDLNLKSDPYNKNYLFIKPDRTFTEKKLKGPLKQGYWHINGHKPHVTFIVPGNTKALEYWEISIQGSTLKMVGLSDGNINEERVFARMNEFSE